MGSAWSQPKKVSHIEFCGVVFKSKQSIEKALETQYQFLQLHDNDTIADIGAGSGWYEGALSTFMPFHHLTFYLVDIDTRCLNQQKVDNMVQYYSFLKGDSITNRFLIVNNTPDSLFLPVKSFRKVWIMNTLHEISDQTKIARAINNILQPGGEVIVLELLPRKEGELHINCNKPLLTKEKINNIFSTNGFVLQGNTIINQGRNSQFQMLRFLKQ
jgi:ubiquinone/menaquinone biosynthesis C-methylase UbiE